MSPSERARKPLVKESEIKRKTAPLAHLVGVAIDGFSFLTKFGIQPSDETRVRAGKDFTVFVFWEGRSSSRLGWSRSEIASSDKPQKKER